MSKRVFLLLFFLSIVGNAVFFYLWQQAGQHTQALSNRYPLLSKRALDATYPNDLIVDFLPLRSQIYHEVNPYMNSFALDFEYLPTGTTIGINEDDNFTAESLLKVPIVMAYFHKKERLVMTKDPIVTLQRGELNAQFGDLYKKGAGYPINLSDAVKLALEKSDNTASLVLAHQITNEDFKYVYDGLDIPETVDRNRPIITVQEYTSILKALYFGSVLTGDDSEYILSLLTKTDFNDLLPGGVPKGIPVAHKIGLVDKEIYQDCGIVYAPERPYALCMVSQSDYQTAKKRMQTVSKMIYMYVSRIKD